VTVPTPSNQKKQSLMNASRLRKALRAAGHHLSPVVQVGKEGVTSAVLKQLDEALLAHELVKVKVGSESPEDRFEAAARLSSGPGVLLAQLLGRTMLVYRRHPQKPKFEPEARPARAAPVKLPRAGGAKSGSPRAGRGPAGGSARGPSRGPARGGAGDRDRPARRGRPSR
jgi:RNA-binding protein